jgi:hypothetical protein
MSEGGHHAEATATPATGRAALAIGKSVLHGAILWLAEVAIACVPLTAHEIVAEFSGGAEPSGRFDPIPEICILAVVISGLSIVSLARFGAHEPAKHTPFTFIMLLPSVFSLMSGAVMYGLAAMGLDHGRTSLAYWAVSASLLTSFLITLEKSVREAQSVEAAASPRYVTASLEE